MPYPGPSDTQQNSFHPISRTPRNPSFIGTARLTGWWEWESTLPNPVFRTSKNRDSNSHRPKSEPLRARRPSLTPHLKNLADAQKGHLNKDTQYATPSPRHLNSRLPDDVRDCHQIKGETQFKTLDPVFRTSKNRNCDPHRLKSDRRTRRKSSLAPPRTLESHRELHPIFPEISSQAKRPVKFGRTSVLSESVNQHRLRGALEARCRANIQPGITRKGWSRNFGVARHLT
ncbi:hypothetical protein D9611_014070 [Ephemerocybe angulata]|uniref:Uncharacterized protein n=1 Tax=Ephemerocybe angulata TaxID=980116 RepID=A0A8H5AS93_9AGAR|nr:hypothetical protein D9611_014070 [Tulosesus angulatus]